MLSKVRLFSSMRKILSMMSPSSQVSSAGVRSLRAYVRMHGHAGSTNCVVTCGQGRQPRVLLLGISHHDVSVSGCDILRRSMMQHHVCYSSESTTLVSNRGDNATAGGLCILFRNLLHMLRPLHALRFSVEKVATCMLTLVMQCRTSSPQQRSMLN